MSGTISTKEENGGGNETGGGRLRRSARSAAPSTGAGTGNDGSSEVRTSYLY